jgi:hypothetical protein
MGKSTIGKGRGQGHRSARRDWMSLSETKKNRTRNNCLDNLY